MVPEPTHATPSTNPRETNPSLSMDNTKNSNEVERVVKIRNSPLIKNVEKGPGCEIGHVLTEHKYLEMAFGAPTVTPYEKYDKTFYMWNLEITTESAWTFNVNIFDYKLNEADYGSYHWHLGSSSAMNEDEANKVLHIVQVCIDMVKSNYQGLAAGRVIVASKFSDGREYPIITEDKTGETSDY